MAKGSSDLVDINVKLEHETDKAWLVEFDEEEEAVWVPKSQAELADGKDKRTFVLTCPQWLAEKLGMV